MLPYHICKSNKRAVQTKGRIYIEIEQGEVMQQQGKVLWLVLLLQTYLDHQDQDLEHTLVQAIPK